MTFGEPVLASAITTVHAGRHWYRGRDAIVLAETETLESVARLLRGGDGVTLKRSDRPAPPTEGPPLARAFLALAGLSVAVSAGIAGFHVGVEQGWWEGLSGCSAGATPQTLEELRALVSKAPVVRCTDIPWQALGLSMAGWNFVAALATAAFGITAALRAPRSRGLSAW
ncbi:MAG: disulfide bond formation protein B [Phenylobacterium sp.]|nr:disulfide bond formation protein B [Phenylobacterium sp.]